MKNKLTILGFWCLLTLINSSNFEIFIQNDSPYTLLLKIQSSVDARWVTNPNTTVPSFNTTEAVEITPQTLTNAMYLELRYDIYIGKLATGTKIGSLDIFVISLGDHATISLESTTRPIAGSYTEPIKTTWFGRNDDTPACRPGDGFSEALLPDGDHPCVYIQVSDLILTGSNLIALTSDYTHHKWLDIIADCIFLAEKFTSAQVMDGFTQGYIDFNSFAWTVGLTTYPIAIEVARNKSTMINFYKTYRYSSQLCENWNDYDIVVYCRQTTDGICDQIEDLFFGPVQMTLAALKLPNGKWSVKLGNAPIFVFDNPIDITGACENYPGFGLPVLCFTKDN